MKKTTIALIIFIGLTVWLSYDKITGLPTDDLTSYIDQIAKMSKTVAELQAICGK